MPANLSLTDKNAFMDFYTERTLKRLRLDQRLALQWYLSLVHEESAAAGKDGISIPAGCTGSDNILDWLEALSRSLPGHEWDSRFACELDAEKRRYNYVAHPGQKAMCAQIAFLGNMQCVNAKSPTYQRTQHRVGVSVDCWLPMQGLQPA
jgi:hypothetical protein